MDKKLAEIRKRIPALSLQVAGRDLVYLDNAATSQKPYSVLQMQTSLSEAASGNVHRAIHRLSVEATEAYEAGRAAVCRFINADSVILTSGATASLNLLAFCFAERYLGPGDKVLLTEAEHHSNLVPWQMACARKGAEVCFLPIDESGEPDLEVFARSLDSRVKLVALPHISNILGVVNPLEEMISIAHSRGIPVAVDGAQGIVHAKVDVQALDCDFYAFSGHKIYAPTGTGVLYGRRSLLEEMPPYMGGGDMVGHVSYGQTTYNELPLKFEAGTPNFTGAACFAPALTFASELREDAELQAYGRKITEYLMEALPTIDGLKLYGVPKDIGRKSGVFSMTIEGTHPSDLAQLLDQMGIAVRSGLMCAEPFVSKYSQTGMLRASLLPYNTMDEAEYFVQSLRRAVKMLR